MAILPVPAESTVGYLGPAGTFSEQALLTQPDLAAANTVAIASFADILFAVNDGELDYGFVAVENAIEGVVNVTLDTFAFDVDVMVQREVILPIEMNLMAKPGVGLDQITTVSSFPHAHAQTRDWLRDNLPNSTFESAASTAEAARLVAQGDDPTRAAIGNSRAGDVYGLEIIGENIALHSDNATRFVLVTKHEVPAPSGHDKTSVVVFQKADEPGSLLEILQEFAARRINLTLLLSRPTRTSLGDYCFFLDFEGHIDDEVVADCLRSLKARQANLKFFGSFPRADSAHDELRATANKNEQAAEAWVDELRSRVIR